MTDEEMKKLERMATEDQLRLRKTLEHPGASNREKQRAGVELGSPYGPSSVLALIERVRKAEAQSTELSAFTESFATTVEAASAHAENDGKGMQAPFHGDFAGAKHSPSMLQSLRWWARAARETMGDRMLYSNMLKAAERRGAEGMREMAAGTVEHAEHAGLMHHSADRIRRIPLPGDDP